jgi:hypothetical protein
VFHSQQAVHNKIIAFTRVLIALIIGQKAACVKVDKGDPQMSLDYHLVDPYW